MYRDHDSQKPSILRILSEIFRKSALERTKKKLWDKYRWQFLVQLVLYLQHCPEIHEDLLLDYTIACDLNRL